MPDPVIGQKLGDYVIQQLLGRGGMARVYKGYDAKLMRYAAVKIITTDSVTGADLAESTERFRREARAIARLHHPNIVGVYQFGEQDDMYYMAMAFVEGQDLRQIIREYAAHRQTIPFDMTLEVLSGIGGALDYAHSRGVIHRDVKPSNVMIDEDGHPILTDFGLALKSDEGTLGDTFGSAHYIAPEQAISSAKAIPQSDIYSLGVCLFEALTGYVPFDDPSAMTVALMHLNEPPPSPRQYNPSLPLNVEKVVLRALEKDPAKRFVTATQMALAFEAALNPDAGDAFRRIMASPPPEIGRPSTASRPLSSRLPVWATPAGSSTKKEPMAPRRAASIAADTSTVIDPTDEFALDASQRPTPRSRHSLSESPYNGTTPGSLPVARSNTGRWLALLAVAVIVVALIGGVLAALTGPTQPTPVPTATGLASLSTVPATTPAIASTATPAVAPTQAATGTAGSIAAATGTRSPVTATPLPPSPTVVPPITSAAPTDQVTQRPDQTATQTDSPDIMMMYIRSQISVLNVSGRTLDLSGLVFVQRGTQERRFAAIEWEGTIGALNSPRQTPDGRCFQIARLEAGTAKPVGDCNRVAAYRVVNAAKQFWVAQNSGTTEFEVLWNEKLIARCTIGTGLCDFSLPTN